MSRRIRLYVLALVTTLALGATACATTTGPSLGDCTGNMGSGTCE